MTPPTELTNPARAVIQASSMGRAIGTLRDRRVGDHNPHYTRARDHQESYSRIAATRFSMFSHSWFTSSLAFRSVLPRLSSNHCWLRSATTFR